MNRLDKEQLVQNIRQELLESSLVVVTTQSGMTVSQATNLRNKVRSSEAKFKVLKNTLAKIAVKGTPLEGITPFLKGPTALAYSKDPIAAAKVSVEFGEDHENFKVLGGVLNGQLLKEAQVKALAKLPSIFELRGQIAGLVASIPTRLARIIREPGTQVARVIHAHSTKE